jgi:hypothetical protein
VIVQFVKCGYAVTERRTLPRDVIVSRWRYRQLSAHESELLGHLAVTLEAAGLVAVANSSVTPEQTSRTTHAKTYSSIGQTLVTI